MSAHNRTGIQRSRGALAPTILHAESLCEASERTLAATLNPSTPTSLTSPLAALNRCRTAWEATQPQLVIDGWADALDEADRGKPVGLVEPASAAPSPEVAGGLALNVYGFGHALHDEDMRDRTQRGG